MDLLNPPQRAPITLDEYIAALCDIRTELHHAGIAESPQVQAWSVILKRHHAVPPRLAHAYVSQGPREHARFWNPADGERHKGQLVVRIL